jgi:hypothetical protein
MEPGQAPRQAYRSGTFFSFRGLAGGAAVAPRFRGAESAKMTPLSSSIGGDSIVAARDASHQSVLVEDIDTPVMK